MDSKAKKGRGNPNGGGWTGVDSVSFEGDFQFDGLPSHSADDSSESDSDGEIDSDVEDAIYAQLYFQNSVKSKRSGKRVSLARQLGSREVRLQHAIDGSGFTSISFVMDTKRKLKKKSGSLERREGAATPRKQAASAMEDGAMALGFESPSFQSPESSREQEESSPLTQFSRYDSPGADVTCSEELEQKEKASEDENESRCNSVKKKYHLNRASISGKGDELLNNGIIRTRQKWGRKSSLPAHPQKTQSKEEREEEEKEEEEEEGAEVGIKDVTWAESEDSSSEDSDHSSDMDVSSDNEEGKLYLEVAQDDPWHIVLKDVMGRDSYERQYERRSLLRKHVKCFNCRQKGQHRSTNCPHPIRNQVCYVCAGLDHICARCPEEMCTYCFQKKHKGRPCSAPWGKQTLCQRCFTTGHDESICHEQWRQYHNTTDRGTTLFQIPPNEQMQRKRVFCYNCGRKGHFGYECSRERPRGYPNPLVPLIAAYDDVGNDTYDRSQQNRKRRRKRRTWEDGEGYPEQRYSPGKRDGLLESPGLLPTPPYAQPVYNGDWGGRGPSESRRLYSVGRQVDQRQRFAPPPPPPSPPPHPPPLPPPPPPPRVSDHYLDPNRSTHAMDLHRRTQSEPTYQIPYNSPHSRHSRPAYAEDFPRNPLPPIPPRNFEQFPQIPLPPKRARRDCSPPPPPRKHMRRASETVASKSRHRGADLQVELSQNRRRSDSFERGFHPSGRALSVMERHSSNSFHRRYSYGNR